MSNQDTENAHGQNKPSQIVVNGQQHLVTQQRISYEEVVGLAYPNSSLDIIYAVDYANDHGKDGTLTKGQSTKVHEGMSFNVIKSNRS